MHLLKYDENGELTITSFNENELPHYAILSHTWGADNEEVTFPDIVQGSSKAKPGYKKICFCGEQARQDGLEYFWIDTCCIDQTDKAELSHAIQSIFRWYQNAVRCYVYLSDVSKRKGRFGDMRTEFAWEPSFRASRWFTRSWTLQELLAPSTVEFFSQEWEKLGDKTSLMSLIHKITSIPYEVLNGAPLSQFSVNERLRWNGGRQTKREEDGAYSLQGILDVKLAPVYGEGAAGAFRRLMDEIDSSKRCIQDLRSTDPREDKKRIEQIKGGLLADSYRWILNNTTFQQWQQDPHSRLLWVKGDPGKGKTMLLCGIINELQETANNTVTVSYFFCQATDSRINTATAVLRGLLYMLVDQQPSLVSHVRKKHDLAGESLFNDANAWVALTEIFVDVLRDSDLRTTYLIIDALDECVTADLPKLLDFVAKQSSASSRVKWIVSSRNWPDIEAQLERAEHEVKLSLELNEKSVAAAVAVFIRRKVDQLAQEKQYKVEVRHAVLQHLRSNADNTFLWVALVCQDLETTPKWNVLKKLALFPPGLDASYERMMHQISKSDDADICWQVLASAAILYRPVSVPELVALVEQLKDLVDDLESVREIIGLCGSFLTLREDTVYFVHQSAKDFLFAKACNKAFPSGIEAVHRTIFSRSLAILSKTLYRDMYSLEAPGFPIEHVKLPKADPLAVSQYPCVYWIDHLCDSNTKFLENSGGDLQVAEVLDEFLRTKYLYWLEGLSLCKSIGKGVISITKLWSLVQEIGDQDRLSQLVHDAWRFIMYHKGVIECYPLQTYVSALLFSPTGSPIRKLFQHEESDAIRVRPTLSDGWSACLQTFEGHSHGVRSVAFSHDSTRLASASGDMTVKIWDASSGACLLTLEGHSSAVRSVAFSHDSTRLASASDDSTIKIWDVSSGACLHTIKGHSNWVNSVAFSHDSTRLASASDDSTIKIWDVSSGAYLQTLEGHSSAVRSVAFSHDSTRLASASDDSTVKIWDTNSGACVQTLKGHSSAVILVAFSHDSTRLASASDDSTIKIWDVSSGAYLQTLSVGKSLDHISFDTSGLYLHTNIGPIRIIGPSDFHPFLSVAEPQYLGLALSANNVWIRRDSQNLVWLPSEYRPLSSAVSGKIVGLGVGNGRVWICTIQLDTIQGRWKEIEDENVQVLEAKETIGKSQLQSIGQNARTIPLRENSQALIEQRDRTSLQIEKRRPFLESDEASIYDGTTAGGGDSIFTGQTRVQSAIAETGDEESTMGTLLLAYTKIDDDIRSLVSEGDDNQSQVSTPNIGRSTGIENAVVSILATNPKLAPVYEKALQLMPKERFADNFRRILKVFHEDLKRLDGTLVAQELVAILRSKEARTRIARKITERHISLQNSWTEQDLQRIHRPDKTNFSYLESWLTKSNFTPLLENVPIQSEIGEQTDSKPSKKVKDGFRMNEEDMSDEQDTSDEEERSNDELESGEGEQNGKYHPRSMGTAQFPRLDLVTRNLVGGEPFRDMVTRLNEFLLPDGLLRDILPIPREHITYDSQRSYSVLNAFQGLLEDLTDLEWNWWPLPPRMRPLSEGETRVFWRCLCGTARWRTLKPAQKHILKDILEQTSGTSQRLLLCTSHCSPAVRTNPQPRPASSPEAQLQSVNIAAPTATYSPPTNSNSTPLLSNRPIHAQTSSGASSAPNQNSYQQKKPLWLIFKVEGSRSALVWDQVGDEGLSTDRSFQQKLKQRHYMLRGRLRLWFSYWRLSYWEFVKLQKTRPGRLVDRGIDLPVTFDYEYSPRPPEITAKDPWISRHEFEEIVKSCITPCWLGSFPTLLGFHDCACPEDNATRLVDALPKRDSEFMIQNASDDRNYVWGIHARYVVSALYVFSIHFAILGITVGLWVWWQRNHPDDLQGASVPVTVAGICISTFWASTGILKGLR